ncbi:PREDICTED: armadillo repeat-containing protein 6-like [Priapulus caudatus]|uniref:Armadillo repeat-containing protein 6-like n=1 Tax=Priapulus caudatus TaxID=37621 RepID=A0ABM1DZ64_PRICU|nr:PREDICTED: armadillo repeat-containing protein 6-like [Priapulus caudatus]
MAGMKRITQETFDDVVKENEDEFEMEHQEAVEDAIKQFTSQGIDLTNIITTFQGNNGGGNDDHKKPLLNAISELSSALSAQPEDEQHVASLLSTIRSKCEIDIAHRCYAGNNGAYPSLVLCCQKYSDNAAIFEQALETVTALLTGQPDLVDSDFVEYLVKQLQLDKHAPDVVCQLLAVITQSCIMHEANRQKFVSSALIPALFNTMGAYGRVPMVVRSVCIAVKTLTLDDDIRVPFGKAHDTCRSIVEDACSLDLLLNAATEHRQDKETLAEVLGTLAILAVRNEYCQHIVDMGGLKLCYSVLLDSIDDQILVKQAVNLIKAASGNDNVKDEVVKTGGVSLLLQVPNSHGGSTQLCECVCAALATLALRNPDHADLIVRAGGAEVVVQCMKNHPAHNGVQKQACMALRNFVARVRQHKEHILELGAESLLRRDLTLPSCQDEAKAALRDLDCQVVLNEIWKGTGKELQRDY